MSGLGRKWWALRGLALAAAVLFASVAAPPAIAQSGPEPAPTGRLTGAAAWQVLVGNTIVAKTRTGGYSEFYAPDGVVKHLDRDGTSIGRWTLQGQKICFDYPEEDDAGCVAAEVEGNTGVFIDEDATRDTFEILPGNAKSL